MRVTAQKAIRAFLRLCLLAVAGAGCGLFLGFAGAVLEIWLGIAYNFDDAWHNYTRMYAGAFSFLGAVGGLVDFAICATWPKTTGLLLHPLLWVLIAGNVLGAIVLGIGRPPAINVAYILGIFCFMGATFGFVMAVVNRIGLRLLGESAKPRLQLTADETPRVET